MNEFDDLCMNCFDYRGGKDKCPSCGVAVDGVERNRAALEPGTILAGKYLIGRVLGQGGFGITYLGFDLNLKSKVAIKEFYPNGLMTRRNGHVYPINDENQEIFRIGVDNFYAEAENLARFRSNQVIVNVYDFFRANGTAYIVMEKITGKPLEAVLAERGGKMSFDETLKILNPVMDALRSLHEGGLLHRDIAPDNVFLADDGRIRLIDFGAIHPDSADASKPSLTVVKSGFAPIEQYTANGQQGPWTDLYGLAALFYRCLIGRNVPDAPDRLSGGDDELERRLSEIPNSSVRKALLKALAVDPNERFQTVAEFRAALNEPPPVTLNSTSAKKSARGISLAQGGEEPRKVDAASEKTPKSVSKEKPKAKPKTQTHSSIKRSAAKKAPSFPIGALVLILAAVVGVFAYMNWLKPTGGESAKSETETSAESAAAEPTERIAPTAAEPDRAMPPTQTRLSPTVRPTDLPRQPDRKRTVDNMIEVNVVHNGRSFWIDEHEISYGEYNYFYTQNGEAAALKPKAVQSDLEPIVNISRANAVKYCTWAGARLPTYEEWKAAAGFGTIPIETRNKKVNCSGERPSLVSSQLHPAGKFGAYDLYGNVWEWINATADAELISQLYPTINNPMYAVIGGSYLTPCADIQNAAEVLLDNGVERGDIGFRCARDD